jgi:hypothetical protein
MASNSRRPFVVWLALAFFAITLALHALALIRLFGSVLDSGAELTIELFLGQIFAIMVVAALIGTYNRSSWGRRFSILCFVLMCLFSFFNFVTLLSWLDQGFGTSYLVLVFVVFRGILSFYLAVTFGISRAVAKYFEYASDSVFSVPPPPPSFNA